MLTVEEIKEIVNEIEDPILQQPLKETDGIKEVKVNEERQSASVKVAISKLGGQEQLDLQMAIVKALKEQGVKTVGLRFEELDSETIEKFRGNGSVSEFENLITNNGEQDVKFIAVASGKGGVGKSTVTVNLAVQLARLGYKVGVIDADIYGFSVPDMMGISERPDIDGEKIIPVERHGVKVISMSFFVEENTPVIWRGPMLGNMINNFFVEVEWGELDYLLLDLPPGTGDVALDIHQMLPTSEEIIVTTPHPTAAFVAARAGAMAMHTDHNILGVIENMSYFQSSESHQKEYIFGKGGGSKLATELKTDLIGQIPLGQPTWKEEDFSPSIYQDSDEIGQIYKAIARQVIDKTQAGE